jgi:hypothetical protein
METGTNDTHAPEARWQDPATRLTLNAGPSKPIWRVYEIQYGPLNPRIRDGEPSGRNVTWQRFDIPGCVTVYGADTRLGAFYETLAYAKLARTDWQAMFDDLVSDDPVGEDWAKEGHMQKGTACQQWRVDRGIVQLKALHAGFYVDMHHSDTINVLRNHAEEWLPSSALDVDPSTLDVSVLTSNRRDVTCSAAKWISRQVLADGSEPRGIAYSSRHGTDMGCRAAWVPLLGEQDQSRVAPLVSAYFSADKSEEITSDDPDLKKAAMALGLRCFLILLSSGTPPTEDLLEAS